MIDYNALTGSHDLTLPDWGPYSFDLSGISHIADLKKGLRMDFFFVPALYRRNAFAPETLRECGCTPWAASGDFTYWSYRQTMIPGAFRETEDALYAETSFSKLTDNFRLARIEFVNHTDEMRQVSLYGFARLGDQPALEAKLPEGAKWIDGMDYCELHFAKPRFDEHLVFAAGRRGEKANGNAVGGRCLGRPYANIMLPGFGANKGDIASWNVADGGGKLYLRACVIEGVAVKVRISFNEKSCEMSIFGTGDFELTEIPLDCKGDGRLTLEAIEDGNEEGIAIDGFVVADEGVSANAMRFLPISSSVHPFSEKGFVEHSAQLMANGFDSKYIIWWNGEEAVQREYSVDDIRKLIAYNHGLKHPLYSAKEVSMRNPGNEYCHETYLTPINVPAKGRAVSFFVIGENTDSEALRREFASIDHSDSALEAVYQSASRHAFSFSASAGKTFNFGQQLLSAAVMTNCLFPIGCNGKWIRHHSPEKYYHSLYTWDSGFIGLGLLELDVRRGIENLNAYVTEETEDNAFVNLGTPLPVQAYLYAEIWNRTQDLDMLEHYYTRMRRYYNFMAGHFENSTFRKFKTNMLCGFDYFYNSGGWDDYPAQWYLYRNGYSGNAAPVVTTAHVIRFAKILEKSAELLNEKGRLDKEEFEKDCKLYDADIQAFTEGLQKYSWSEKDGIFSYVVHNDDGTFKSHWLYPDSDVNFNYGLDGVSPLVSGICTEEQQKSMWNLLKTEGRLWTKAGITAVDPTKPYFRADGYWSGTVWMPHQWFVWKAALAAGDAEFARRIAKTAIRILSEEAIESRGTYEHYSAVTGKGAGCFHFGGLTSIVLNFYNAYYKPGRLTVGHGTWILSQEAQVDGGMRAVVEAMDGQAGIAIYATGDACAKWTVFVNGEKVEAKAFDDGSIEIPLPASGKAELEIVKANR